MYVLLPNEPNERWFEHTHTVSQGAASGRWGHWHQERSWPLACSPPPIWGLKLWALTGLPPWWLVRCGLSWQGGQEPHRGVGCSSDFQEPHCPQEQNKKRSSARRIELKRYVHASHDQVCDAVKCPCCLQCGDPTQEQIQSIVPVLPAELGTQGLGPSWDRNPRDLGSLPSDTRTYKNLLIWKGMFGKGR